MKKKTYREKRFKQETKIFYIIDEFCK